MSMLWILMALLVLVAAVVSARRRRSYESVEAEPWRQSLESDDEPLDMDEIRRAEDEWLDEDSWEDDDVEDEPWR